MQYFLDDYLCAFLIYTILLKFQPNILFSTYSNSGDHNNHRYSNHDNSSNDSRKHHRSSHRSEHSDKYTSFKAPADQHQSSSRSHKERPLLDRSR